MNPQFHAKRPLFRQKKALRDTQSSCLLSFAIHPEAQERSSCSQKCILNAGSSSRLKLGSDSEMARNAWTENEVQLIEQNLRKLTDNSVITKAYILKGFTNYVSKI
jgi:hypothetical protein